MNSSAFPLPLSDIQEQDVGEEKIIYSPSASVGVSLNSTAAEIWDFCDGKHSLINIVDSISLRLKIEDEELREALSEDIEAAIKNLAELGVLQILDEAV